MSHRDESIQQPREGALPDDRDDRFDRPDRRGPRGNQEVETIDVERGEANIERVLGW